MLRAKTWTSLLVTSVITAALAGACGGGDGGSGDGGSATTGPGGAGGAGGGLFTGSTGTSSADMLSISPQDPVLDVDGSPASLQFTAALADGSAPASVAWEVSDVVVGTIDGAGAFGSKGLVAGTATVTARAGALSASTTITVRVAITQNPGGVSADDQIDLQNGGSADPDFRFLYPYDATVFPRGLRAPELHLAGAPADATYVRISLPDWSYEGFFGPSAPTRVALPQDIWRALTLSAAGTDTVSVEVTKLSGGQVTGPVSEAWTIAPGDFKGVIYYNTYLSAQTSTGAVMRIRPNVDAEVFLGGCNVCHSVSANGNVLVAGVSWTAGNPLDSASYDLLADGSSATRWLDDDGRKMSFGGLSPNGEWMITNGAPSASPIRGLTGPYPSRLIDTLTGEDVAAPSFTGAVSYALTPAFAPDGTRLAFSSFDTDGGRTLAAMDVDLGQSPPMFSNLQALATAERATAGWPSFLPDAAAVVYHDGDAFDTAGYGGTPRYAELRLVDLATRTVNRLYALNGRDAGGAVALPYGEAEEGDLSYEPTVLPLAVGGYYWVVFTSRRAYGHTIAPGGTVAGGDNKWGSLVNGAEIPSVRKKLWVAAIDINYPGKPDPSHPAFYLGEQELEAGNMRAFVALDPCKDEGAECESGAECCNGFFCRQTGEVDENGEPVTACVPPPAGECANIDESCETAADCCVAGALCINHRCALPPVE